MYANDDVFVSYLVYLQLETMKQIQDLIDSSGTYNNYECERGLFYYVAIGIAGSCNEKASTN